MNNNFFKAIKPTLVKLREIIGNEFVIFGSAPLYLLNIVEFKGLEHFNDIDIAVIDESVIPKNAKKVTFQGDPDKIFYKIKINNINIDIGIGWPDEKEFFPKLFINPIDIEGFKFVNLDTIEEWKQFMVKRFNRQKDKQYLKKIKEYNNNINTD